MKYKSHGLLAEISDVVPRAGHVDENIRDNFACQADLLGDDDLAWVVDAPDDTGSFPCIFIRPVSFLFDRVYYPQKPDSYAIERILEEGEEARPTPSISGILLWNTFPA